MSFISNLQVDDVVNLRLSPEVSVGEAASCLRARVCRIAGSEIDVLVAGEAAPRRVSALQLQSRMRLPWKPADLRHSFIVLRRRIGRSEEHVEDLRVRKNFLYVPCFCFNLRDVALPWPEIDKTCPNL